MPSDLCRVSIGQEHDVNSVGCWCGPEVLRLCHECQGDAPPVRNADPDCWACSGRGLIAVDPADIAIAAESENREPWIIVHRDTSHG